MEKLIKLLRIIKKVNKNLYGKVNKTFMYNKNLHGKKRPSCF